MVAVNGSAELRILAARLKAVGARELRLEMLRGLRAVAKPLIADVRVAAREKLPRGGGLNDRVADSKIATQVRTTGRTAGVRIVASQHDAKATNFGKVRHPVFGRANTAWVEQQIPAAAGWFLDTLRDKSTSEVGEEMARVQATVAAKLTARAATSGTVRLSSGGA